MKSLNMMIIIVTAVLILINMPAHEARQFTVSPLEKGEVPPSAPSKGTHIPASELGSWKKTLLPSSVPNSGTSVPSPNK